MGRIVSNFYLTSIEMESDFERKNLVDVFNGKKAPDQSDIQYFLGDIDGLDKNINEDEKEVQELSATPVLDSIERIRERAKLTELLRLIA